MVSSGSYSIVGYTPGPNEAAPHGRQEVVGGDYFRAMRIPLRQGPPVRRRRRPGPPARRRRRPVPGRSLLPRQGPARPADSPRRRRPRRPFTIVGVVGTINAIDLGEPVTKERLYYPVTQAPRPSMALVIKTALDPQTLISAVRAAVQAIDPEQPIADVRTMDEWMGRSLADAPRADAAARDLRRGGAAAVGHRHLRRAGLRRRAARARIRHPAGARRRPPRDSALVLGQGVRTAGIGVGAGPGRRARAVRASCRASCSAWARAIRWCLPASPDCCWPWRWPPAISPPAGRRASIRSRRSGTGRARFATGTTPPVQIWPSREGSAASGSSSMPTPLAAVPPRPP